MDLKSKTLRSSIDLFVELFYDHFFEQTFEVAHIFRNTQIGSQKEEFKTSMLKILDHEEDLSKLNSYFNDLGLRHMCYEVSERHYNLAKASFIYALEKTYDVMWSDTLRHEWEAVLDKISMQMIEGAKRVDNAS